MTHDLLACTIEALGGRLDRIVIDDLRNHTFIASLHVQQGDREVVIDSRPSDAIALGVALDTPIFVEEKVLDDVLKPPQTKQDRLQLLRDRLATLQVMAGELQEQLDNAAFVDQASPEQIQQVEDQLDALTTERQAIQRVLDKLG